MLASILLAGVMAEAKTVTCRIQVSTIDNKSIKINVSSKVLDESDLRYKINAYNEVRTKVPNADHTVDYSKLFVYKELCNEPSFKNDITQYVTQGENSLLVVRCGNEHLKTVKFNTNALKVMQLKEVFTKVDAECQK